ncbi:hypothetical protein [Saccharopolyspora sp. NPDC003762]
MPWLRLDDIGYDDPLVRAVGNGAYGAVTRMGQYASAQRTDGWIPADKAREIASRAELRALTAVRIGDGAPMLHAHGDDCRCLQGVAWNEAQGGYWIHAFLDRNPSRSENDVHRAKARELKDKELRRAVKDRDGDTCRYCGITVKWADRKTPAGGVLDHVDPKIAAGADNLVVACRGCNGRKKDCTPEAAGLALLPPPADPAAIYAGSTPDQPPNHAGSTPDHQIDHRPPDRPAADPQLSPVAALTADPAPNQSQNPQVAATNAGINGEISDGMTAGTGRGRDGHGSPLETGYAQRIGDAGPTGRRPTVGPSTTPRNQLAPNPYSRTPAGQPPAPMPAASSTTPIPGTRGPSR